MAVSEGIRSLLSQWCATRIPDAERDARQIGYTIHGDEVTIIDRRAPAYPELGAAWTTTPLAQLRHNDPQPDSWSLYRPTGEDSWRRRATGEDPLALLEQVER